MIRVIKKLFTISIIILTFSVQLHAQSIDSSAVVLGETSPLTERLNKSSIVDKTNSPVFKDQNSTLPLAVGLLLFLYLLNPMLMIEDGAAVGMTKEVSLGFGALGQYRLGGEYSFIFRSNNKSQLRFSANYDILTADVEPSNMLQASGVISVGGGVFTDFDAHGFFPQISYGYSIRNDKMLIYPHVKARYTFVNGDDRNNIFDLSFGIIIGIANPFIDLKIRRKN